MHISYLPHPPSRVLSDGDLALSFQCSADIPELAAYGADPALLGGIWVSGSPPDGDPHSWARGRIDEFLARWQEPGGPHGATLAIRLGGRLVGFVYMSPQGGAAVELSYGIAPPERGRGLATRAAAIAAAWALNEGGFGRALLYVDTDHHAGHRVAAKAGFHEVDRVDTYIEQTGESFVQVVYELARRPSSNFNIPSPKPGS